MTITTEEARSIAVVWADNDYPRLCWIADGGDIAADSDAQTLVEAILDELDDILDLPGLSREDRRDLYALAFWVQCQAEQVAA